AHWSSPISIVWAFRSPWPVANAVGATGDYVDGDLDGQTVVVEEGTGGVFQVGPTKGFVHCIEVSFEDLRASSSYLNLGSVGIDIIGNAMPGSRCSVSIGQ
ncbi:MAG: hypothetical protein VX293_06980, partial [Candidatus Latescibacterota bacterium]|nr:hypothetical protein [Candidatus Latescibacterota bacterium]